MFCTILKELRIAKGLSQQELGDLTQLGQSNISAWERGERNPLPDGLIKLANYFGCSIDYLLGYSVKPNEADEVLFLQKYRELDEKGKEQVQKLTNQLLK